VLCGAMLLRMASSHDPSRFHNLNVPVPLEMYEALRTASFQSRLTMAEIVRRSIESHLTEAQP
jgi:predicted DNA-binding protein